MTRLRFLADLRTLARAKTALVVAPAHLLTEKRAPRLFSSSIHESILALAARTKPGDRGNTAGTLTAGKPAKVVVGVLPDRVSRHNCAARPEAAHCVIQAAALEDKDVVVLVVEQDEHLLPLVNAVGRAFPLFQRKSGKRNSATIGVLAVTPHGRPIELPASVRRTAELARQAARLVDTPPTELHPKALALEAKKLLAAAGKVRVREIVGGALLDSGLGGIHAVGRTALVPPRMLIAEWRPANARGTHVALVGKGVTYDTGGLHLKARGAMETMKADMGGAAAALGAFCVLVAEKPTRPLSLVLCLAENAIGPNSYKPDDILTLHSKKTVEINNTDAEGRLLLADGVSWAARVLGAKIVIDAATLTGAQLIATGDLHAAVVSNVEALERTMIEAGRSTGDLTHPLPFAPEFYKKEFATPYADMRNSVKNRNNAQSSCAAQFIWWHIEDTGVQWGHLDLAGPAHRGERGTGFGVALLAEVVRRMP